MVQSVIFASSAPCESDIGRVLRPLTNKGVMLQLGDAVLFSEGTPTGSCIVTEIVGPGRRVL